MKLPDLPPGYRWDTAWHVVLDPPDDQAIVCPAAIDSKYAFEGGETQAVRCTLHGRLIAYKQCRPRAVGAVERGFRNLVARELWAEHDAGHECLSRSDNAAARRCPHYSVLGCPAPGETICPPGASCHHAGRPPQPKRNP